MSNTDTIEYKNEAEIQVLPGKTHGLTLQAKTEIALGEFGNVEVKVKNKNGEPYIGPVDLQGDVSTYKIPIDGGAGEKEKMRAGNYKLQFPRPGANNTDSESKKIAKLKHEINFESDADVLPQETEPIIKDIVAFLQEEEQSDVIKIEFRGYGDLGDDSVKDRNLAVKRAINVKKSFDAMASKESLLVERKTGIGEEDTTTQTPSRSVVQAYIERGELVKLGSKANIQDPSDANHPRILVVGDSWSENMWRFDDKYKRITGKTIHQWKSPIMDALAAAGLSRTLVAGELTGLGGTTSDDWFRDNPLDLPHGTGPIKMPLDYTEAVELIRKARAKIKYKNALIELESLHRSFPSKALLKMVLEHFKKIDIIHLSLGANDIYYILEKAEEIQFLLKTLHEDPNDPADTGKGGAFMQYGWRRKLEELSPQEKNGLEQNMNQLTARMDSLLMPIFERLKGLINFIHTEVRKDIKICIVGYTQLFWSPQPFREPTLGVFNTKEDIREEINDPKKSKPNHYFSAWWGMDRIYFNGVVLATLERFRQQLSSMDNVLFKCFYFDGPDCDLSKENIARYFDPANKLYEKDPYLANIKKLLNKEDGYHHYYKGHRMMADECVRDVYLPLLKAK